MKSPASSRATAGADHKRSSSAHALANKLPLVALHHDANTFHYGKERWDLIAVMYMGPFVRSLADRLTDALKSRGVLVSTHF